MASRLIRDHRRPMPAACVHPYQPYASYQPYTPYVRYTP